MMTSTEFYEFWHALFPDSAPINYALKYQFPERCLRLSHLSSGRHCPGNESEWEEVLRRYNHVMNDLIGSGEDYLLVIGSYDPIYGFPEGYDEFFARQEFSELKSVPLHEIEPADYLHGDVYLRLACRRCRWHEGDLDHLLRRVVVNQQYHVLVFSLSQKTLVCPCDGGIDIFLENETVRDLYRKEYRHWLQQA
jgi:hypothetical protein